MAPSEEFCSHMRQSVAYFKWKWNFIKLNRENGKNGPAYLGLVQNSPSE